MLALRATARVVAEHGWPPPERLEELPGVGPYTAAALGSFAWDAPMAAVDTNVRRVIERRDGLRRTPRALARRAAELVPEGRAAAWNQAMMELGATVCRPRRPRCGECPLQAGCAGPDAVAAGAAAARRAVRGPPTAGRAGGCSRRSWRASTRPPLAPERRERALAGLRPRRRSSCRGRGRRAAAAVRRVALTLRADAVEAVLDRLMPLLPQGVYERALDPERTEVAFFGDGCPPPRELDALAGDALLGREEEEVPDSREERRRRAGRAWTVAGRLRVRSPDDPPPADGALEVVIEPAPGAFGTGAHPTTRACLELLLELEPGGGLADLGCGSGVVAIAAARLGWEPVYGLDFDERSRRGDAPQRAAQRRRGPRGARRPARDPGAARAHARGQHPARRSTSGSPGSLSPATAQRDRRRDHGLAGARRHRGVRARRAGAAGPPGRRAGGRRCGWSGA